ncbi:RNA polymerase sigma-70 factor (ECF subfamily) [Litoreibacter meonggei]|uniref:RNA polymerase sigma factor n=1 Tax=Litoreibacter meonggei TaxID=1049199 RepID=A0A497WRI6_9RHOB|nr:sigma-70 family RNA polymerase sigma factor [Litoreibacter meonggei]RLJ51643.1 RNA polymerase sigma-70 factor (ECF subfamily) [Litoreibacter meonggei]
MTTPAEIEKMIAQTALRDQSAFSALYDATSGKLFGVCLRVLNNRGEAEEVLQEVYIRIWHKADNYAVTGHSPMTWLITVARNLAIDRLRTRKAPTRDIETVFDLADEGPGPEAAAIASSQRTQLNACLDELEPERADAVKQAYLAGETYKDLAARHAVPLNTMRTWLRRSLLKLKECLTR